MMHLKIGGVSPVTRTACGVKSKTLADVTASPGDLLKPETKACLKCFSRLSAANTTELERWCFDAQARGEIAAASELADLAAIAAATYADRCKEAHAYALERLQKCRARTDTLRAAEREASKAGA
jgi:hypothetical protein